ncbi:hypothetical protein [Streptomyces kebangsaanensis]|uniref:hypothetical protein n=1 Tax=Streptomyces kebangsaanensis TaxID=864058 RepID=UPI00093B720A|nr:hypothetical protein [Streptomyces kebangsaanensis]
MTNRTVPTPTAGEPAGILLELPASVVEVLGLPALEDLRDDQAHGRNCVWCSDGPLTVAASVDLGEQTSPLSSTTPSAPMRWFPRACRPCIGRRAYGALLDHAPGCKEGCRTSALGCEIGRTLNRLVREGRR